MSRDELNKQASSFRISDRLPSPSPGTLIAWAKVLNERVRVLSECMDIQSTKARHDQLVTQLSHLSETDWKGPQIIDPLRERGELDRVLSEWHRISELPDMAELAQLTLSDPDTRVQRELADIFERAARDLTHLEHVHILSRPGAGPFTGNPAILSISAAGMVSGVGEFSSDAWVGQLARMYLGWAQQNGIDYQVIDDSADYDMGHRSVTLRLSGDHAFGYLQWETGRHQLIGKSSGRVHQWLANVTVIPRSNNSNRRSTSTTYWLSESGRVDPVVSM